MRQHVRRDADAAVAHGDAHFVAKLFRFDRDLAVFETVLRRVRQQIAEDLRDPHVVADDVKRRIRQLHRELVPLSVERGLHGLDGGRNRRREIDRFLA
ncbi:hypothetical protein AWB77_02938 [Caballeronia fortuita]|uniref:Uncharacterized protein n=1 Tax=Caballeronia fortuita TaxID=1777138 RepID=A0A158BJZ9_9BURK|nr:hypothetical protein AWB77_02938 [Caballeronia fortuita]